MRIAAEKGDLTCVVLRVGNAYGTLLPRERMQGLIGVAINNVLHNAPIRLFGNPANVRDYIHLEDICTIAEKAAATLKAPFTILNVGSGVGHAVGEVLNIIEQSAGVPVRIESAPVPPSGEWLTDWVVLDITKAREVYGWSPVVDLAEGIRGMLEGSPAARGETNS